ncbi:hypothetical protein SLA2020_335540 [Shorea laevis]
MGRSPGSGSFAKMPLKDFMNQFSPPQFEQGTDMEFQQLRGTCRGAQSSQRGDIEAGSVSEVEAKVIQFLKDEEITKEELASRIRKLYRRGEHREVCLEIKKGLEILFAKESRELFWFGASAYKMSQPRRSRLITGFSENYDEEFPVLGGNTTNCSEQQVGSPSPSPPPKYGDDAPEDGKDGGHELAADASLEQGAENADERDEGSSSVACSCLKHFSSGIICWRRRSPCCWLRE